MFGIKTKYIIGMIVSGDFERPESFIADICEVEARTLREAKSKWAKKTKNNDESWNVDDQTYCGSQLVKISKRQFENIKTEAYNK